MTGQADETRRSFDPNTFHQQADILNAVLDHLTQGMVVVGSNYRVLAFNRYFEELFQLPPGTVQVGVDFRDILKVWAEVTGQDQQMLDHAILQLDEATPFEFEFPQQINGQPRWCLLTHNPLPGKGFARTFTDITERKQAEDVLRHRTGELAILLEATNNFAVTLDLKVILQTTTDRITELTDLKSAAVYLLSGEMLRLWATTPPLPPQFPEELRLTPLADHPHIVEAIATRKPIFLPDALRTNLTDAEKAVTDARGLRSILYLPLMAGVDVLGVLIVSSVEESRELSEEEQDLCQTLANVAAMALANGQLYESSQVYGADLEKDITERKQAENALLRHQAMLSRTEAIAHIGSWEWVAATDAMTWSEEMFRIHKRNPADGPPPVAELDKFFCPEDMEKLRQALQVAVTEGTPYQEELQVILPDGESRTVLARGFPFIDSDQKVDRLFGSLQDITERKRAEAQLREAYEFNNQIIQHAKEGVIVYGLDLRYRVWNSFMEQLSGKPASEVLGKHPLEVFPFLSDVGLIERLERVLAGESVDSIDFPFEIPATGKLGWTTDTSAALRNEAGEITGVIGTVSDITERKLAEEKLRQSEESLAITLHSIGDAVVATDVAGLITRMNPTAERLTGWSLTDALGRPLTEVFRIIHSQTRVPAVDPVQAVLTHGEVVGLANHTVLLARDGQEYQIADSAAPIRDATGRILGVVLVFSDVTERYRLEETLSQTTDLLKNASEIAKVGGWELELASMKLTWSLGTYRLHELDPRTPVDIANAILFYAPEAQPVIAAAVQAAIETGTPYDLELPLLTAKGRAFWAQAKCNPVTENGRVIKLVGAFQDITERKQMEELLRKKERYQRALLDNFPFAVWLKDTESRFLSVNAGFVQVFGAKDAEELVGKNDFDIAPRDMAETYRADDRTVLDSRQKKNVEEAIWTDGVRKWFQTYKAPVVDDNGILLGTVGFARDITEHRQAEEEKIRLLAQLQQSQKMESLGTLAGGVAHDMNNVLGAILGLASAHIGTQPQGSPLHQALDTICKATERGGKMVKSLLSFARQSPAESNKLDMNAILREQVALLERTTLAKVRLEIDLEANLRPILGDANALTHAFMNLCVNAVEALPENGTLTLHTRNVDNDWIEVVVEDNGTGMTKEVLEKAMEPFYTTKETGKGTGLGLSMVFSTVKAHRGQMSIESEPGKGTRVMMRFPACEQEAPVQAAATAVSEAPLILHRTMKVLLIDDDELIQSSVQMILEVLGHTAVTTAQSGEEALAMLEAGLEADLVILDMNMPGLGGIGTLPRLRGLRPEVPVLLATGRVDQTALNLASAHAGVTLLAKPFGLRELQKHLESLGLG